MKFTVKTSNIKGKGCFATKNIKEGEFITKFLGKRFTCEGINKRIEQGLRIDDPIQIGEDLFIEIEGPQLFFNHSCDPNSGVRGLNKLIAIKDISKGEEITFDYSSTVGKNINYWDMDCKCNSPDCRKKLGNIKTIPKQKIKEYFKAGILQDFIRKQLEK